MGIAFSKTISDLAGAPIISTKVNTFVPCSGFDQERLILSGYAMQQIKFSLEKELPIETCQVQDWHEQERDRGSRFRVAGHVSLYDL